MPGAAVADCPFCRIVAGEIPADLVREGERVVAFRDINPQAPLHVLVIPKQHIATTNDLTEADEALVGKLVRAAAALAAQKGYADRGYRVVFNCNAEAGQTVFHIHLHLLAGRSLGWPPG
jgi:histidine triad (HIT) family protein